MSFPSAVISHAPTVTEGPRLLSTSRRGWDTGRSTLHYQVDPVEHSSWRSATSDYAPGTFFPPPGLRYRGQHNGIAVDYVVDDYVRITDTRYYRCRQGHNSLDTATHPGTGANQLTYWEELPPLYVVGHSDSRVIGGITTIGIDLLGSSVPLVNGIAKKRRLQSEGGLEQATVTAPVTAYVGSTGTIWSHDGTQWNDTGSTGNPNPGQLAVSSPSGLPNSLVLHAFGLSAGVTAGGRMRYSSPRVTIQEQYIASAEAPSRRYPDFTILGHGTAVNDPDAGGQTIQGTTAGALDLDPLPNFTPVTNLPPQFDGIQIPWGWVLVERVMEPLLDGPSPLHLITDTFTHYQNKEFM